MWPDEGGIMPIHMDIVDCWRSVLLACVIASGSSCAVAQQRECSQIIVTDDSDYSPLHWYDGKSLNGASIEIATTALKAIQAPFLVRFVGPLERVLQAGKDGDVDLIASLRPTPERMKYLEFNKAPVFANPPTLYVAKGHEFIYSGWNDLIGRRGGMTAGNQFGGGFDDFMKKNLTIEVAQKTYMNFKKLELGRIDYFIAGYYNAEGYLLKSRQQSKFVALKPAVANTFSTIAFSKRSPCLKYQQALDTQIGIMRDQGVLDEILERNIRLYRDVAEEVGN